MCGKPLVVPEQPPVQAAVSPEEAAPSQPPGTPWERREELGFLPAWGQTLQLALFEPSRLFSMARLDRGAAQLGFAVLTASVFSAIGQVLERALLFGQREQLRRLVEAISGNAEISPWLKKMVEAQAQATSWAWVIALALFTPVFSLVLLYLNAAITHLIALVLGQSKRGFPATFAACAYACAPLVLLAVPACGSIVAVIWLVVLTGVGLKQTHGISPGGAAAAVLAPYAFLCCLMFAAIALMAMVARNAMVPQ